MCRTTWWQRSFNVYLFHFCRTRWKHFLYTRHFFCDREAAVERKKKKKKKKELKAWSTHHTYTFFIYLFFFFLIVQYDCHRQEPRHLPHSSVVVFISFGPVNHSYSKIIAYFLLPDDHILLSKMLTLWSVRTINPEKILKTREGKERGSYTLFLSVSWSTLYCNVPTVLYVYISWLLLPPFYGWRRLSNGGVLWSSQTKFVVPCFSSAWKLFSQVKSVHSIRSMEKYLSLLFFLSWILLN